MRLLLQEFSRAVSSSLRLSAGLEPLCSGTSRLFAAGRSTIWLHDRRARTLAVAASSDPDYQANAPELSTADTLAPEALAMRRDGVDISSSAPGVVTLTVPLKGRRRALGTLVLDGVRPDPGAEMDLVGRAQEAGRQISAAIESVLLLEDVLQSRRQLEDTFNSLADLIVVCDGDGRITDVNRAFSDRIARPRADLMNRLLEEVVAPAMGRLVAEALHRGKRRQAAAAHAEIEDTRLNGTFIVTVTPLTSDDGKPSGAVLVARDITPHAKLEAERAELRSKLVQSEKLAALGQFVAGIAHELNNPLQGVLGHLELMRATGAFPKALRRDMHRIYREAERAAKIVRNLLVFAGSRRLTRRPTNVNAVLARVLAFRMPGLKGGNIEVGRHIDEGLPRVKGDALLLQQALMNVVINAEQAIGMNGHLAIAARFVSEGAKIVIEIHDSGPGIPAAVLPRIFEPFYTTKEVGKGTGLGLAIAYGIIQEHGGQISAANHPSGGAVFTIQLPVQS
jgi:PAS domain S-box-containing protein